ncbi:hypothetical protein CYMTET_4962 [Cymbomonas tetramitiformis]|uniref:Uncharacterized protein n=1 Tax=Cymbomonas tetramitiformis TaxID=36881 RepID=A0AAE0LJU8_9CHLO|nr:hypothetical protein CYMTET_4962 [Cymbomonas tetramitiformis]
MFAHKRHSRNTKLKVQKPRPTIQKINERNERETYEGLETINNSETLRSFCLREVRDRLRFLKILSKRYAAVFKQIVFLAFTIQILLMQRGGEIPKVQRAHNIALESNTKYLSTTQYVSWLHQKVQTIWKPVLCGDNICTEPFEFPSYGRLGCEADCGYETNLLSRTIIIKAKIPDDLVRYSSILQSR